MRQEEACLRASEHRRAPFLEKLIGASGKGTVPKTDTGGQA